MSPRVYRLKPGWIAFFIVEGMIFLGMAIWVARLPEPNSSWMALPFLAAFGAFTLLPLRARVELDDHWIAVHGGFSMRRLDRRSIVGRRMRHYQHAKAVLLLTEAPGVKPLELPFMLRFDAEFEEWLATLRDFDAEAKAEVLESLGASHDERSIARAKVTSRRLTALAWVCLLWVLLFPRPYHAAIGASLLLPLIALLLLARGRGLYSSDQKPNDPRPTVAAALILPGFGLAMRMMNDVSLLRPAELIAPTVVLSVALGVAAVRSDPRASRWSLLIFPLLLVAYAASAMAWANCTFDSSPPQVYQARIEKKSIVRGKSRTYSLVLGPWGPRPASDKVDVSQQVYERVQEGSDVRVVLRDGGLRMQWFNVVP